MDKKAFVWGDPRPEGPSGIQDDPPPGHTSPYEFDFPYGGQSPDRVDNTSAEDDLKHLWDKKPAGGGMVDDLKDIIKKILTAPKEKAAAANRGESMFPIDENLKKAILQKIAAEFPNIPKSKEKAEFSVGRLQMDILVTILEALKVKVGERYEKGYLRMEDVNFAEQGIRIMLANIANRPELYSDSSLLSKVDSLIAEQAGSGKTAPKSKEKKVKAKDLYDEYHDMVVTAIKDAPAEDKEGPLPLLQSAQNLVKSWGPSAQDAKADPTGEEGPRKVQYDPKFSENFAKAMEAYNKFFDAVQAGEKAKKGFSPMLSALSAGREAHKQSVPELLRITHNMTVGSHPWFRAAIDKLRTTVVPKMMFDLNGLEKVWDAIFSHSIFSYAYHAEERASVTVGTKGENDKEHGRVQMVPVAVPDKSVKPVRMTIDDLRKQYEELKAETNLPVIYEEDFEALARTYASLINQAMVFEAKAPAEKNITNAKITNVLVTDDKLDDAVKKGREILSEIVRLPDASEETQQIINKMKISGNNVGDLRVITDAMKRVLNDPSLAHMEAKPTKELPSGAFGKPARSIFESGISREASALDDAQQFVAYSDSLIQEHEAAIADFESTVAEVATETVAGLDKLLAMSQDFLKQLNEVESHAREKSAEEPEGKWYDKALDWASETFGPGQEPAMATASAEGNIAVTAADDKPKGDDPEKHRPEVQWVPRKQIMRMKQFISNMFANYGNRLTENAPKWAIDAGMTGAQMMESIFQAGLSFARRFVNDTHIYIPKMSSMFAQGLDEGTLDLGLEHDKKYQAFKEKIAGPKLLKARALAQSLRETEKLLADAASSMRKDFGQAGMTDFLSGSGESMMRLTPDNPLSGIDPEDPEAYKKLDVEKVAMAINKILSRNNSRDDMATRNRNERLFRFLTIVLDRVRLAEAEAIKEAYGGQNMPDEAIAALRALENKPYRIDVKLPDRPEPKMEDVGSILQMLREQREAIESARSRGITEFTKQDEAELQALVDKEEMLKASGERLTPEEEEKKKVLNEKLTMKTYNETAMAPAEKKYFHYHLSPDQAAAGATNLDVLINSFQELQDLYNKSQEYNAQMEKGEKPTGEFAKSVEALKAKLAEIEEAFRKLEADPVIKDQINLVEVKANPLLKDLYEKYYRELSGGENVDWSQAVPSKKQRNPKAAMGDADSLFRGTPFIARAAADPEFDQAVAGAQQILEEIKKETSEIVTGVATLGFIAEGPGQVQASRADALVRKADRIAGSDMYKEYDLSPNSWAIVESVDGAKKLTIDKKTRGSIKDKLANKAAFDAGSKVAVDFDDAIRNGTVVAHLGGSMYKVRVEGRDLDVDGGRIFKI